MSADTRAEGGGTAPGDAVEGAGEVALVGKTELATDVGQRGLRPHHALASFADTKAVGVLADALTGNAPKDSRKMNGMHTSFARQSFHSEPLTELDVQLFPDATQPGGSGGAAFGCASDRAQQLGEQALNLQVTSVEWGAGFGIQFDSES